MRKTYKILLAPIALCLLASIAVGEPCPGPKFGGLGICDSLDARKDHEFLLVNILFAGINPDSGKEYSFSKLKERSQELFTKYDLRSAADIPCMIPRRWPS
jgi:hypothetical protein